MGRFPAKQVRWSGYRPIEETQASAKRELTAEKGRFRSDAGQANLGRGRKGKLLSPARRRACIDRVRNELNVSERRACRVLRQHRSTQRKGPVGRRDEDRLVGDMIALAQQYGRYGYRRTAALLRDAGWQVNDKRVERRPLWASDRWRPYGEPTRRAESAIEATIEGAALAE